MPRRLCVYVGDAPLSDWNPALYTRFEDERTRPARDLLSRVSIGQSAAIVDLGCGPGNSTELLVARYPDAAVLGLDSSPAMVEAARTRLPHVRFELADAAAWAPPEPVDLIYANAVLQWLPDHRSLLPRLMAQLRPGGVLAIQMPDNLDEPSHEAMRMVAREAPWAEQMQPALAARAPLPSLPAYYDMLSPEAASVDVWRTVYQHPMRSPAAIVEWVRSTGLRPFLSCLMPDQQADFEGRYQARLAALYPAQVDGQRLLAFPRIFIVAHRAG